MLKPLRQLALTLTASFTVLTAASPALSAAIVGNSFNAAAMAALDDASTPAIPMGFSVNINGTSYNNVYVNTNGNVTFGSNLTVFNANTLNTYTMPVIAPFWADVDTRVGSAVTYGTGTFEGRAAFGVNWVDVACYDQQPPRNSFQLILVDRSDTGAGNIDVVFNYDKVEWEAGTASQGSAGTCRGGGKTARAGLFLGPSNTQQYYELPGAAVVGAYLDGGPNALVTGSLASTEPGRYVFSIRNARLAGFWQVAAATPPAAEGSITCPSLLIPNGQNATCTATPQPGYVLASWGGDCQSAGRNTTCTISNVTRDQAVSATFAPASAIAPAAVPTLGQLAMATLGMLAALLGVRQLRRRAQG